MSTPKVSLIILVVLAVIAIVFIALFIASVTGKKKLVNKVKDMTNEMKLKDISIDELKTDKESLNLDIKRLKSEAENLIKDKNEILDKFNKLNANIYRITDIVPEKIKDTCDITKKKHFCTCWMKLQNEAFELGLMKVEDGVITLKVSK